MELKEEIRKYRNLLHMTHKIHPHTYSNSEGERWRERMRESKREGERKRGMQEDNWRIILVTLHRVCQRFLGKCNINCSTHPTSPGLIKQESTPHLFINPWVE